MPPGWLKDAIRKAPGLPRMVKDDTKMAPGYTEHSLSIAKDDSGWEQYGPRTHPRMP
jgi:hypothetical protein